MKKWYVFYAASEHREKLQQLVAELEPIASKKADSGTNCSYRAGVSFECSGTALISDEENKL